jgi:Na+/proline symporter
LLMFSGIAIFYYYQHNPNTMPKGGLDANHVLGYFVATELSSPLSGLIIACLMGSTMSMLAASYASMATMLVKDFIERLGYLPKINSSQMWLSKGSTAAFGIAGLLLALFMQSTSKGVTDNINEALMVWGTLWFILLMAYLFGTQTKWMKARAMWWAMLIGIVLNLGATWFLYYDTLPSDRISFIWVGFPGFMLACTIAVVLNVIFEGLPGRAKNSEDTAVCISGKVTERPGE